MKNERLFNVEINGRRNGGCVGLAPNELDLFEQLSAGVEVFEIPQMLMRGDPNEGPGRYFKVKSTELGDSVFADRLELVLASGFVATPPGGEIPAERCFPLHELKNYSARELEEARFVSMFAELSAGIVNGSVKDPFTNEIEVDVDKAFKSGKSSIGVLRETNIVVLRKGLISSISQDLIGLKFVDAHYKKGSKNFLLDDASSDRGVVSLSGTTILPDCQLIPYNVDFGDRDYDAGKRRIWHGGFSSGLVYQAEQESLFTDDVMLTNETIGIPWKHSRQLVFSQRGYRALKDLKPRGFRFFPVRFS
ncbi:MAG: hypothetical protein ACJAVK_003309 [Akkermansiaceae bacterium]|jgi:hypothetical protein